MPMLRVYASDETLAGLKRIAASAGKPQRPEDVAEAFIAGAMARMPSPSTQPTLTETANSPT